MQEVGHCSSSQVLVALLVSSILPKIYPFEGLLSISIMSSILPHDSENSEKHVDIQPCFCCRNVIRDHQELGGHLTVHQEETKLRTTCHPGCSGNSINITGINLNLLANKHPEIFSGGLDKIPPLSRETLGFCNIFCHCPHAKDLSNTSNLGNANSQSVLSPNLSSPTGNAEIRPNFFSSAAIASPNISRLSNAFTAPSATGFPSSPSFSLGINEICQFSVDIFRSLIDGFAIFSRDILQNHQHHDHGKLSYPAATITDTHPCSDLNQSPSLNDTTVGSLPQGHCPCLGKHEGGQSNREDAISCEGNKRMFLGDVPGNANMANSPKRQKIDLHPRLQPEEPQKKELLLFKDVEFFVSGLKISVDAEKEVQGDLDLSLHL